MCAADVAQVVREQEVVLKLTRRAHGYLEEASEFGVAAPAAPFRDVGRDGGARATNLTRQPVRLLPREGRRDLVGQQREVVRLLPYLQFSEVLQRRPPNLSGKELIAES